MLGNLISVSNKGPKCWDIHCIIALKTFCESATNANFHSTMLLSSLRVDIICWIQNKIMQGQTKSYRARIYYIHISLWHIYHIYSLWQNIYASLGLDEVKISNTYSLSVRQYSKWSTRVNYSCYRALITIRSACSHSYLAISESVHTL